MKVQIGFFKKYVNYEIKLTHGYKSVTKSSILRLYEKLFFAFQDTSGLINKHSEIISKCLHQSRHSLRNLEPNG